MSAGRQRFAQQPLQPLAHIDAARRRQSLRRHLLRRLGQDVAHLVVVVLGDEGLRLVGEKDEADDVLEGLGIGVLLQPFLARGRSNP